MSWWCSALTEPWSWTFRPYPGVWLFVLAIAALYLRAVTRPARPGEPTTQRVTGGQLGWFFAGWVVLWLSLDWPLGTLGTGYLASAHMLQYLMMVYIAPPLMLKGVPVWLADRVVGTGRFSRALHAVTRFLPGVLIANAVLILTMMPPTVDNFRAIQLGSFALDVVWIAAGLLMWWPVVGPRERDRFTDPMKMVYLFVLSVPALIPAGFLTWATFPIYRLYELAPQVGSITDTTDQQMAGAIMKVGGDLWLWAWIARIWFGWFTSEERRAKRATERSYRKVSDIVAAGGRVPAGVTVTPSGATIADPAPGSPPDEDLDDFHRQIEDWRRQQSS